jgi:hypothetical protein
VQQYQEQNGMSQPFSPYQTAPEALPRYISAMISPSDSELDAGSEFDGAAQAEVFHRGQLQTNSFIENSIEAGILLERATPHS